MLDIKIFKAIKDDIPDIYIIEKMCFSCPWSYDLIFKDVVENALSDYFIAKNQKGEVVGFSGMYYIIDEANIINIAVEPKYRNKGVGGMLVSHMIKNAINKRCTGITLEVRVSNEAAINIYAKFGFEIEGIRKSYYSDNNEDAYIMWLHFDEINRFK